MNFITIIFSMSAAMCFTLAAVHFFVWANLRHKWESLLFSICAITAAVIAMQELAMSRAQTPAEIGESLRWIHVSVATMIIALVWFIHFYLRTARLWLAWLICGLRTLVLVPNFVMFPNATFREISSLNHVWFLGETIAVPVGEANPWRLLIHASTILLFLYVLDASIPAWKQGKRERSLVLGVAISIAIVLAVVFSSLMVRGILPGPLVGIVFLPVVLAMAFELSVELIRTGRLSQELLESQARIELAGRAARLALWEWDIIRDDIWATEIGRARAGASGGERISFNQYLKSIHPGDREVVKETVRQALEGEREIHIEYRLIHPDGVMRWIAAYGLLERGPYGEPLRMRGVSMDVTDRKHVEVELRSQRDQLAHVQRVSAIGQLSTALAHELNQPLSAILRNAEAGEILLRQSPTDVAELRSIFVDIQRDDRRAAMVIDRMRLLLKRREPQFEELAMDELIQQVLALLRNEIQSHHATLRAEVAPDLPKVRGDRIQLQQVILNLLMNSLDALGAKEGAPRQLTVRASCADGKMVELAVADSGGGISPDQLSHVFEPFFTTKTKGTGIGLAISKSIIELHNGEILAENNPDGGATVRFALPAVRPGGAV